jgi:hypothetical protein
MTLHTDRWIRMIVRLYPRAWRDRYEAEMLALVEASPTGAGTAVDLLAGAMRERVIQFAVAYARDGWSRRSLAFLAGSRVLLISIGSMLAVALGSLVPLAAIGQSAAFDFFVAGTIALTIRTSWTGWRMRHSGRRSRRLLVESALWCGAAIVLGALQQASVGPTSHHVVPEVVDLLVGPKGIPFMLAAEAALRLIAADRPIASAQLE